MPVLTNSFLPRCAWRSHKLWLANLPKKTAKKVATVKAAEPWRPTGTTWRQAQKSKSKSKNKNNLFEEEGEDLGPGEMTDPHSALGKLLMANSRVELAVQMSAAGEAVNIREIQIFTQKGLYARRIMDQMGLPI